MREGGKPYEGLPQLKPLQVNWIVVPVGVVKVFFIYYELLIIHYFVINCQNKKLSLQC